MVRGYKFKGNEEKYEQPDRLFFGNQKVHIFDNPNYQQPLVRTENFEEKSSAVEAQLRDECKRKDKELEFYRAVVLIIVSGLVLNMVISGVGNAIRKGRGE